MYRARSPTKTSRSARDMSSYRLPDGTDCALAGRAATVNNATLANNIKIFIADILLLNLNILLLNLISEQRREKCSSN
jgi:hypothetical protein